MTDAASRRLLGVDAARALALVGMVAVHLEPRIAPDGTQALAHVLAGGRASALFAVLAGVGIVLANRDVARSGRTWLQATAGIAARGCVLFAVGLLLGEFDSGLAVILCYYALLFLVAVPVLRCGAAPLLALAVACAVLTPAISLWLRRTVTTPLDSAVPSIGSVLNDPAGTLSSLLLTGYYPVLTWTTYLFVGMAIGRLRLDRVGVAATLTAVGLVLAVAARLGSSAWLDAGGLATLQEAGLGGHLATGAIDADLEYVSFYGTTPTTTWAWLGISSPHSGAPPDLVQTTGSALVALGLMLLLARLIGGWIWPLAAVGSMTFTLYSLHVFLVATWLPRTTDNAVLVHLVVLAAIAIPWRRYVGRGPLEALSAALARAARRAVGSGDSEPSRGT